MKIRENEKKHLEELKSWLASQRETPLEEMDGFFAARVNIYDEHMSVWAKAYERLPDYLPAGTKRLLDLGVGTGLELESIYRRFPSAELVGMDLSETIEAKVSRKRDKDGLRGLFYGGTRHRLRRGRIGRIPAPFYCGKKIGAL